MLGSKHVPFINKYPDVKKFMTEVKAKQVQKEAAREVARKALSKNKENVLDIQRQLALQRENAQTKIKGGSKAEQKMQAKLMEESTSDDDLGEKATAV